jgi:hypothetical protein
VQFFSDAPPVTRRTVLPLAVLVSGVLYGVDGLIVGEDRLKPTLIAVWLAWALWRMLGGRYTRAADADAEEQGEPA